MCTNASLRSAPTPSRERADMRVLRYLLSVSCSV